MKDHTNTRRDRFERKAKREYEVLRMSGDLEALFPHFTGEWKYDKEEFLVNYNQVEHIREE